MTAILLILAAVIVIASIPAGPKPPSGGLNIDDIAWMGPR